MQNPATGCIPLVKLSDLISAKLGIEWVGYRAPKRYTVVVS